MSDTMWVKICGMTQAEDIALAVELGAQALGFIFYPNSPRAVTVDTAQQLLQTLPTTQPPARVGVFVNASTRYMQETAEQLELSHIQLHGQESPATLNTLSYGSQTLVRAVRLSERASNEELHAILSLPEDIQVLLDAGTPQQVAQDGQFGGRGEVANWRAAAYLAQRRPIWLAGGLNAENVAEAVAYVQPAGLDLVSGVEAQPGRKSPEKMRAFFRRLKGATQHEHTRQKSPARAAIGQHNSKDIGQEE